MQIINQVFFVGPNAAIVNFDTSSVALASQMSLAQQLKEDPNEEPLSYHDDPIIIIPTAMIVRDEENVEDIVTSDTNRAIDWIIWEGGDNNLYMVRPEGCYGSHNMTRIQ